MGTAPAARPATRYAQQGRGDAPSKRTGRIVVIGFLILLVGLVIVTARYVQNRETAPASVALVTYERQDDRTMRLWVDITRQDPEVPSYCIVTALNYAMAEVGRREVIMPAGGEKITRLAVDLPTRDYPVSGGTYGCSTTIPGYMNMDDPNYEAR